ncbi:hypothetical protein EBESD8_61000 [Rhodococcus aetherivorans]|nr:hypothetical protein EBESD8_61000 [Rhodococcus aetherivorans]
MMSDVEVARFETDGFVCLRRAVPAEIVAQCRDRVWDEIVPTPDDPSTWTEPVVRVGGLADPPFGAAATAPALVNAYDRLVGVRRWVRPGGLGTFPVRFPHPADPGDTGWHLDGGFFVEGQAWPFVNIASRGRGLLMLFLLTDVGPEDAPTRIKAGSHLDVPRYLAGYGERGRSVLEVCQAMDADGTLDAPHRASVEATGEAGDVYLCHPFLVHAAQRVRSDRPRVIAQPPLELVEPLRLDDTGTTPVEVAVRRGLGTLPLPGQQGRRE